MSCKNDVNLFDIIKYINTFFRLFPALGDFIGFCVFAFYFENYYAGKDWCRTVCTSSFAIKKPV